MFTIICVILFTGLLFKTVGAALKVTWCVGKVVAAILFVIALPVMIITAILFRGLILLVPIALIVLALGALKTSGKTYAQ